MVDDDDKKFEAALAGFLHREKRERNVFCPDAELLAAYYEDNLSPEEKQVARLHVEGCSYCQEVLAHLKRIEEHLLAASSDKMESAPSRPPLTFPGSAAEDRRKTGSFAPVPNPSRWRWIAPAGAIAASLVLWLAYHHGRSPKFSSGEPVQVAENRKEADKPADYYQPQVPPSSSTPQKPTGELDNNALNKMERSDSPSAAPASEAKTRETDELSAAKRTDTLSDAASESRAVQEFSNSSAVAAKNKTQHPTAAPPPAANAERATTAQNMNAAGTRLQKKMSARLGAANTAVIIHTPDASVVWRVGAAGSVDISIDGGNNWHSQISAVTADLSAGSAPLASVCWVVGRSGTILVTTDSGATWRKISSPTTNDLAEVVASDALHASICGVNGERFDTADGGMTWNRVASE